MTGTDPTLDRLNTEALVLIAESVAHIAVSQTPKPPDDTVSSLLVLDATEELVAAARHLCALWDPAAAQQSGTWWGSVGRLSRAVGALEAAENGGTR